MEKFWEKSSMKNSEYNFTEFFSEKFHVRGTWKKNSVKCKKFLWIKKILGKKFHEKKFCEQVRSPMRGNMLIVSRHISIDISYSRLCRYCSVCLSPSQLQTVQYIPYRTVPYINWSKVGLYGTPIPYGIRYGTPCGTVYRIPKFGPLYIGSVYRKFWTKWLWTKLLRTNLLGPI